MLRFLTKVTLAGGTVYAATSTTVDIGGVSKRFNIDKSKFKITKISTLEDLELLEKYQGCQFAFVDSWDNKTVYNARKFLNVWESKKDGKKWRQWLLESTNRDKEKCKPETQITMFFNGRTNKFHIDNPPAPKTTRRP